jgi:hypothetical protein
MRSPDLGAEAEALSDLFAVDLLPGWRASLDHFSHAASTYAEFQLSLSRQRLAFVTLGKGEDHLASIDSHLREVDIADAGARVLADLQRAVPNATWGVKTSLSTAPAVQVYVKKPLPVADVLSWLGSHGTPAVQQQRIAQISTVLDKSYTHFFGLGLAPGAPPAFDLYFTQYTDGDGQVAQRITQLWDVLGIPEQQRQLFDTHHPVLSRPGQTVWVSVGVVDGALLPAVKLDYAGVPLRVAMQVADDLELDADTLERLRRLPATFDVHTASYLGWRLQARPTLGLYFTRRRRSVV